MVTGLEGVSCGKGYPPPQRWRGRCPSQEFFFHFGPQNGQFRCIVGAGGGMHPPSGSATGPVLIFPDHVSLMQNDSETVVSFYNYIISV